MMERKFFLRTAKRLTMSFVISFLFMSICLFFTENLRGAVWGWFSEHISNNETTLINTLFVLFFFISMVVFVVSYMWISMRRASYVRKMMTQMNLVSKGDFSVRLPVNGNDELSYLSASINSLVDDVNLLVQREKDQDRRQQEFITQIAHDLRTPLTSVMGYLKLIEKDVEMDPDQERKYIGVAVRKAEQLQKLINELFDYMKLCDDELPIQKDHVDLVRLIEQVMDEIYPIFDKNGIECEFKTDIRSLPIVADGALIARLFDNLLNNAIKYGKDGKKIDIFLEKSENGYTTRVRNYGTIIAQEDLNKIFEKFYRTDSSRSSSTGGTGLGLAIASNIVRRHGGRISCKSSQEDGTSFIVFLPDSIVATE